MVRPSLPSLLVFFVALVWATFVAVPVSLAQEEAPPAPPDGEEVRRSISDLTPKELNQRIKALDKTDGAVRFARAMQRDGILFLVAGGALAGVSLGVAAAEGLSGQGQVGPYVASVGVPSGIGLIVAGIPQVILSYRLQGWYSLNGPAPSSMARLKLLRRWRLEAMQWMRDGSLLGAAFLGAAGLFSAVFWAVRDAQGANGVVGDPTFYSPLDATTSMGFLGAAGGLAVSGLAWLFELKDEQDAPHRLFAMPTLSVSPVLARHGSRPSGVTVQGGLVMAF